MSSISTGPVVVVVVVVVSLFVLSVTRTDEKGNLSADSRRRLSFPCLRPRNSRPVVQLLYKENKRHE